MGVSQGGFVMIVRFTMGSGKLLSLLKTEYWSQHVLSRPVAVGAHTKHLITSLPSELILIIFNFPVKYSTYVEYSACSQDHC